MDNNENKNNGNMYDDPILKDYEELLKNYDQINSKELHDLVDISSKEKRAVDNTRTNRAKNFTLQIDESSLVYDQEEPRVDKGEIYFANRPATNRVPETVVKRAPKVLSESPIKRFLSKDFGRFGKIAPLFILLFVIAAILSSIALSCLNDVFAFGKRDDKSISVKIEPSDTSTKQIIRLLDKNGLIVNGSFCNFFVKTVKVMRYDFSDADTSRLSTISQIYSGKIDSVYLPGEYDLQKSMGVEGMLNAMKEAQKGDETVKLTFPEGWTVERMIKKLSVDNDICSETLLRSGLQENNYEYDFMSIVNEKSADRYQRLEGYLYPSTYEFFVGESVSSVINRMLEKFDEMWTDEYQKRAEELGYTQDEIIIIASIIEKEAGDYEQMGLVSSVIHNRLNNPAQYPALQCDSTSDYVTNAVAPFVNTSTAQVFMEKYNTKNLAGLPSGPICNPGGDAIKAALYPATTNYYYFQHDNNGKIYMAETVAQHRDNYTKVWNVNNGVEEELAE